MERSSSIDPSCRPELHTRKLRAHLFVVIDAQSRQAQPYFFQSLADDEAGRFNEERPRRDVYSARDIRLCSERVARVCKKVGFPRRQQHEPVRPCVSSQILDIRGGGNQERVDLKGGKPVRNQPASLFKLGQDYILTTIAVPSTTKQCGVVYFSEIVTPSGDCTPPIVTPKGTTPARAPCGTTARTSNTPGPPAAICPSMPIPSMTTVTVPVPRPVPKIRIVVPPQGRIRRTIHRPILV